MGHITLISIWEKVELSSLWASSALFAQRSCFSSRSVTLLDLATRPRGSLRSVERPRQSFTGVNTLQRTRLVRPPQSTTPLTPSSRRSSRFWMLLCPLLFCVYPLCGRPCGYHSVRYRARAERDSSRHWSPQDDHSWWWDWSCPPPPPLCVHSRLWPPRRRQEGLQEAFSGPEPVRY